MEIGVGDRVRLDLNNAIDWFERLGIVSGMLCTVVLNDNQWDIGVRPDSVEARRAILSKYAKEWVYVTRPDIKPHMKCMFEEGE